MPEKDGLGNWKIKPPILKYIGVGIPARSVMAEETTNNLLNFDIEVNIWTHLKATINWTYNGAIKFHIHRGNYFL